MRLRLSVWSVLGFALAVNLSESSYIRREASETTSSSTTTGDKDFKDEAAEVQRTVMDSVGKTNITAACEESFQLSAGPYHYISADVRCCNDLCGKKCSKGSVCYVSSNDCKCKMSQPNSTIQIKQCEGFLAGILINILCGFFLTSTSVLYFHARQSDFHPMYHRLTPDLANKWFIFSILFGIFGWLPFVFRIRREVNRSKDLAKNSSQDNLPSNDEDDNLPQPPPLPRRASQDMAVF